nr:flagellar protein [Rhizobium halophytocola]
MLIGVGVTLAFAAALFPWYVFFNEEKFGLKPADWGLTRDLPEGPGRDVFSVSPLAMVDNDHDASPVMPDKLDDLTTATASNLGNVEPVEKAKVLTQPFPGGAGFRLLHVANGRALIEDPSGMYLVRVGSILPDESKVAMLEMRDGHWVIVTSKGDIYDSH